MCITVNHAHLSNTKILSLPLENGNHFIAYSNKVKNKSGKPNAMILPIPGETNPSMFHNTESYRDFMNEITKKCRLGEDYLGMHFRGILSAGKKGFERFELGMYTIGLSRNFQGAREFLNSLPEDKRPEISEKLKNFFEEKYAGWSFAVCVFDSEKEIDAQPIAFEYKPFSSSLIFFPTLDGHDGNAPDINELVTVDHTFIYEHTGEMTEEYEQKFVTLNIPVPDFLQHRKFRAIHVSGRQKNGDTFLDAEKFATLNFKDEPQLKRIEPVPYVIA
jgi:hypothetical protein